MSDSDEKESIHPLIDPHDLTDEQILTLRAMAHQIMQNFDYDFVKSVVLAYFCWLEIKGAEDNTH